MSLINLDFMKRFMTNLDSAIKSYVGGKVTAINEDISDLSESVGDLTQLDTTEKSDLVSAINEVLDGTQGSGVSSLEDLDDVIISSPTNGNVLGHNGNVWINRTLSPQNLGFGYGVCNTEAATVAKEVILGGYELITNGYVSVVFANAVPANATMSINGKDAKPIYYKGVAIVADVIKGGDLATFIFDASHYDLVSIDRGGSASLSGLEDVTLTNPSNGQVIKFNGTGWVNGDDNSGKANLSDLDDTTITSPSSGQILGYDGSKWKNRDINPQGLGFGFGTCSTAAATVAKTASLSGYELVTNGYVSVKFTNAVPASATLNINSKGAKAIFYKGVAIVANVIKAGDLATFVYDGTRYHLVGIDTASESGGSSATYLSQTLAVGSTYVTFTNIPTSNNNVISIYTSKAGLDYTQIDDSVSGTLKIYFDAQLSAVTVYLKIEVLE